MALLPGRKLVYSPPRSTVGESVPRPKVGRIPKTVRQRQTESVPRLATRTRRTAQSERGGRRKETKQRRPRLSTEVTDIFADHEGLGDCDVAVYGRAPACRGLRKQHRRSSPAMPNEADTRHQIADVSTAYAAQFVLALQRGLRRHPKRPRDGSRGTSRSRSAIDTQSSDRTRAHRRARRSRCQTIPCRVDRAARFTANCPGPRERLNRLAERCDRQGSPSASRARDVGT